MSNSYKHKFGAQKRKEKCDRENEAKKGQLSLGQYFKFPSAELPKRASTPGPIQSELEGNMKNVIIVDSDNDNLSKVVHINENVITDTDNVTQKSVSASQLQATATMQIF